MKESTILHTTPMTGNWQACWADHEGQHIDHIALWAVMKRYRHGETGIDCVGMVPLGKGIIPADELPGFTGYMQGVDASPLRVTQADFHRIETLLQELEGMYGLTAQSAEIHNPLLDLRGADGPAS